VDNGNLCSLFSLLSVQNILFQKRPATARHRAPQSKPCGKEPVRRVAEFAEKESIADLCSCGCSALQSIGIIHFGKDFLPRMSRMPRMENPLIFIRGIREIRGRISLVAPLPRCALSALCAKKNPRVNFLF
jgi:hypothetical protein